MTAPKDSKSAKSVGAAAHGMGSSHAMRLPRANQSTSAGGGNVVQAPMGRGVSVPVAGEKAGGSRKRAKSGGAKKASKTAASASWAFDPFGVTNAFTAQFSEFKMPEFPFSDFKFPEFTSYQFKFPEFSFPNFAGGMPKFDMPKFDKAFGFAGSEEIAEQNAENMKAMIAANTAFLRMIDALAKSMLAYSADSMTAGVTAAREMAESGSVQAVMEKQAELVRTLLSRTISEWAGLSQRSMDAAKDAMAPLGARVEEATEQFFKSLAA